MTDENENLATFIKLGEPSQLKRDINRGIAALPDAKEGWHRPHACLNRKDGAETIQKIAADPDAADTEIWLSEHSIVYGSDVWLNVVLGVALGHVSSTDSVQLTPRQTSYVVTHLPESSQRAVVDQVKAWWTGKMLPDLMAGLQKITDQLRNGDPLVCGTHANRVFDLHGGRLGHDKVPYTELGIVGEELAPSFLYGATCLEAMNMDLGGPDGYDLADQFLADAESARRDTASGLLSLLRQAGSSGSRHDTDWP